METHTQPEPSAEAQTRVANRLTLLWGAFEAINTMSEEDRRRDEQHRAERRADIALAIRGVSALAGLLGVVVALVVALH